VNSHDKTDTNNVYFPESKFTELNIKIAFFHRALELNPDDTEASISLAKAYCDRGLEYFVKHNFDQAINDYNHAIKLNPSDIKMNDHLATAYFNRGLDYYNQNDYDNAMPDFDKAIDLNPKYAEAYNYRGLTFDAEQQFEQAIADYTQAIKLKQNYANAYNNRAEAYRTQFDFTNSILDFKQVIQLYNNNLETVTLEEYEYAQNAIKYGFNYDMTDLKEINSLTEEVIIGTMVRLIEKYSMVAITPFEPAFLWVAYKENHAPIYLFGTQHDLYGIDVIDIFHESIKNIISQVQLVFTELVMSTNPNNICVKLENKSGKKISSSINANFSLDELVAVEAVKQNKVLRCLENDLVRKAARVENEPFKTTEAMEADPQTELDESKNYLTHVVPSTEYAITDEDRYRDCFWLSRLLPVSAQGLASLAAVGSAHLPDLIHLLTLEGYTMTPLMKHAPVPESESVRMAFRGFDQHSPFIQFFKPTANSSTKNDDQKKDTYSSQSNSNLKPVTKKRKATNDSLLPSAKRKKGQSQEKSTLNNDNKNLLKKT